MNLDRATDIGMELFREIGPHCERIHIAGSVRRGKAQPKDIELVCIPLQEQIDLLGEQWGHCSSFIQALHRHTVLKGGRPDNRYTQLQLPECNVDVFTCTRQNWGLIFTLRTGPGDFNIRLVEALKNREIRMHGGNLHHRGIVQPMPEEVDVFAAAGWDYLAPHQRH